jgi:hypothetical protein
MEEICEKINQSIEIKKAGMKIESVERVENVVLLGTDIDTPL